MALRVQGAPYQLSCFQAPTIYDRMTSAEKEKMRNLDEGIFREVIFPMIDTEAVQKLYCDRTNVRPACGLNHFAAMLYVKFKGISEDYFIKHIPYDVAMQYAVGTEDMQHQPFSEKTFQRMRHMFDVYQAHTGEDLYDYLTHDVDLKIAAHMGLNKDYNQEFHSAIRIDSMMIDCHGAVMTRLKIVYTVIFLAVTYVFSQGPEMVPLSLRHYLDERDDHRFTYYKGTMAEVEEARRLITCVGIRMETTDQQFSELQNSKESSSCLEKAEEKTNPQTDQQGNKPADNQTGETNRRNRLQEIGECRLLYLIQDLLSAKMMLERARETESEAYDLVCRVLEDQTIETDSGETVVRDKRTIQGSSLQNPYEPDATYRAKNQMGHHGYSAAMAEQYAPKGNGCIIFRQLEQNIYSDQQFAEDFLNMLPGNCKIALSGDALFTSYDIHNKALEKGVHIFCASSTGKAPDVSLAKFDFSEDGRVIQRCPEGHIPSKCVFHDRDASVTATFTNGCCRTCPNLAKCGASIPAKKTSTSVKVTPNQVYAAKNIASLNDSRFRHFVNKRNGVEGIPSVLRRKYRVDEIPYFGIDYARRYFYTCVTAYNIAKLIRYHEAAKSNG